MEFEENGGVGGDFEFSEKSIRSGFIKKVYAILTTQLVLTFGIVSIFVWVEPVNEFVKGNSALWWTSLALVFVFLIILTCVSDLRRRPPWNFILLGLFTFFEGVMLGCAAAYYDSWAVAVAIIATIAVAAGLTIFAFQTKIDFTMLAGAMMAGMMCLIIFGLFALIFQSEVLTVLYACLGAFLFSLYIVFDTQLIIGGKHRVSISPEEYVFAALNLYIDVVNLFLMLLTLIGIASN